MELRILYVATLYSDEMIEFEAKALENSYDGLIEEMEHECYSYMYAGWCAAFQRRGIFAKYLMYNSPLLQKAWAKEHLNHPDTYDLEDILIEQIKYYKPNVILWDLNHPVLLSKVRCVATQVRTILGYTGSAVDHQIDWNRFDAVISCAPESVKYLRNNGVEAYHIDHAFNPVISKSLHRDETLNSRLIFIGQLITMKDFHRKRVDLLDSLDKEIPLTIYSSQSAESKYSILKTKLKYKLYQVLGKDTSNLLQPIRESFRRHIAPPVYGLDMFNRIAGAGAVLNIHADSSPEFASNMRVFEVTGAGGLLITDYKRNLNELFEPGKEVLVYHDREECLSLCKWALSHPEDAAKIAEAGRSRCFKDHLYDNRIEKLLSTIEMSMG